MQFSAILSIFSLAAGALSQTSGAGKAGYDPVYGNGSTPMLSLACSDGPNGLYTKGYTDLSALPAFPRVAATETVVGWNSEKCGMCYTLTWRGRNVSVLAVDHAVSGFVLSLSALDMLTHGQGVAFGTVDITWQEDVPAKCDFF